LNIMDKLLPWTKSDDVEDVTEGGLKRPERNHGPRPTRTMSSGQIRRAIERQGKTRHRKMVVKHRRTWMDNRHSVAILRGQLQAVGEIPYADGRVADGALAASRKGLTIEDILVERYGSVERALEIYKAIEAEQRGGDKVEDGAVNDGR
jgi:hypothetical protein